MNSHYNIALLADYKQIVNAQTKTQPKSPSDTSQTNTDQTTLKQLAMSQDQTATSFVKDMVNNYKSGLMGRVLPSQCQHSGLVCAILAGYESDNSWDAAITAAFEEEDSNVTLLTYRYSNPNSFAYPRGGYRGHFTPRRIARVLDMNQTHAHGIITHTDATWGVKKPYALKPTESGQSVISITDKLTDHTHLQSLDLAVAFHKITIKDTKQTVPQKCQHCTWNPCRCPAFTCGMPCSSPSSMHTASDENEEDIPELVLNVSEIHTLYPPQLSPSDEEADKEVAQMCQAPVYYRVKSLTSRHHCYYTYHILDKIDERISKRLCTSSLEETVQLCEHYNVVWQWQCQQIKAFSSFKTFK